MDKTKLLTATVIVLLLLNLGTLGFLFISGAKGYPLHPVHGPHGRPMPREIIIEQLHFDPAQVKQYDKLIQWHQKNIRETEDKIRSAKNDLYLLLNDETTNEKSKTVLIDSLASYQRQIETIHFKHFGDIKKLCKEGQLADFENLTEELARMFSRPQKRPND